MTWPTPVRLVGVGSPQGDDSLGWEVVSQVREQLRGEGAIEFHLMEGGQRLLDLLDGRGTLLLIDALHGEPPGTIHRFTWPDPKIEVMHPGSTHSVGVAEALQLAATLGTLPPYIVVYGITARNLAPLDGLSPAVRSAIPELVQRILHELAP